MRKIQTLDLSFMGLYIAMAVALEYISSIIPILQMPQGGSINLAVIPVFMASYHLGFKKGFIVGMGWWAVGYMYGQYKWFVSIPQYVLDYFIPMAIVGLASAFPKIGKVSNLYIGIVGAGIIRFLGTLISGAYFWFPKGTAAGSLLAWANSLSYNFYYNFATLIVAFILVPLSIKSLSKTKYKFSFIK